MYKFRKLKGSLYVTKIIDKIEDFNLQTIFYDEEIASDKFIDKESFSKLEIGDTVVLNIKSDVTVSLIYNVSKKEWNV